MSWGCWWGVEGTELEACEAKGGLGGKGLLRPPFDKPAILAVYAGVTRAIPG